MAVYTRVAAEQFRPLAAELGLDALSPLEPVPQGIENTTYFFTARRHEGAPADYVLTLVEDYSSERVRFAAALTRHLCRTGLPVPAPLENRAGEAIHSLAGRQALVFPRVDGRSVEHVDACHCEIIGDFLARAHLAGDNLGLASTNPRGLLWLNEARGLLEPRLAPGEYALLGEQTERYRRVCEADPELPLGAIHGDLFRDNALFREEVLTGVIDFYQACSDWLLLDVAIVANDWCSNADGDMDRNRLDALLTAYHHNRPFTRRERQYWQDILCFAATRFWVSRLLADPAANGNAAKAEKDPGEYRDKLQARMIGCPPLPH
jgi:homoserine kinase type II